jgi:hypothetical protein
MQWTKKVTKGNNYVISPNRVMVLVDCNLSHRALPLYEVVENFNHYLSSNAVDKKSKKGQ